MGDVVELMLDGVLCEVCFGFVDAEPCGYPRKCDDCEEEVMAERANKLIKGDDLDLKEF